MCGARIVIGHEDFMVHRVHTDATMCCLVVCEAN
eukprot:SAG11_NODE_1944_length_4019_cov_2.495792_6_plen_34_part_00